MNKKTKCILTTIILLLAVIGLIGYAVCSRSKLSLSETETVSGNGASPDILMEDDYIDCDPMTNSIYLKFESGEITGYEIVDPSGNIVDSGDIKEPK